MITDETKGRIALALILAASCVFIFMGSIGLFGLWVHSHDPSPACIEAWKLREAFKDAQAEGVADAVILSQLRNRATACDLNPHSWWLS